jgi:predicted RNA binding protein YcfA (HicA-like mRNA interferase family)
MPFTPREVLVKLKRAGFEEVRQTGSHLFLRNPDGRLTFIVMHRGDIPPGTMHKIQNEHILQKKNLGISSRRTTLKPETCNLKPVTEQPATFSQISHIFI